MKDHRRQVSLLITRLNLKQSGEAADNVVKLELLEAMFLLICNQVWS